MDLHRTSCITELEDGVEYAAVYVYAKGIPCGGRLRPVMLTVRAGFQIIADPMMDPDAIRIDPDKPGIKLRVLGRWDGPAYAVSFRPDRALSLDEMNSLSGMTWQQYAAQQLGQVLRQNALAERLSEFGIERAKESYLPHRSPSAVRHSLVLTYDELDRLLSAANV